MGVIRLLLALAVASEHYGSHSCYLTFVGSEAAVQGFFLISGFYISMILARSYASPYKFWVSRYLRLAPVYWTSCILALILTGLPAWMASLAKLPWDAKAFLVFTNVTLFFQDWVMFTGVGPHLHFVRHFTHSSPPLYSLLWIPQAWSLGVEFSFYLIAPFILRSRPLVVTLLIASLALRIVLHAFGLHDDPWSYRFFPTELALFLVGALSHRWYTRLESREIPRRVGVFLLFLLLTYMTAFNFIPWAYSLKKVLFFAILAGSIPFIFALTKMSRFDRTLGETSYPVYCLHYMLIPVIGSWLENASVLSSVTGRNALLLAVILIMSFGLVYGIEKPMNRFRERFKVAN